jgi:hypothetical protein
VLVQWAMEMWWVVWGRQCRVNYQGMWKVRFAKEDKKREREAEKVAEVVEMVGGSGKPGDERGDGGLDKVMGRLRNMNKKMGVEFGALVEA